MKHSVARNLVSSLQTSMQKAGGKLPGLEQAQIPKEIWDNTVEGEIYIPTKEGTSIMNNAAQNLDPSSNVAPGPVGTGFPPAGGVSEQQFAQEVLSFLATAGKQVAPAPRTWKERALDQAIPAATTIASVVIGYALCAVVERQLVKRSEAKQLASSPAHAQLATPSVELNVA